MPTVATIGVYGFDRERFLDALRKAGVGTVWDVRQRRGVRGPEYAWANSIRLQDALRAEAIDYEHHKELAPTTELRRLQYAEDNRRGVGKRNRQELACEYVARYEAEILAGVDLGALARQLRTDAATALLCVERDPEACHRSLVATRLANEHGVEILHLRPR